MIYFPITLTPIPNSPGYFWDVKSHKLYSIKVGGVLRELACRKLHWAAHRNGYRGFPGGMHIGDKHYVISVGGKRQYLPVTKLKKLKLVDYDIPIINRIEEIEETAEAIT